MNVSNNRVLVLGSAGFVGTTVTRKLVDVGYTVHALGRSETPGTDRNVIRMRGSMEDRGLLREAIAECGLVVHTASLTTPGSSARDPALEVLGNLLPLAILLELSEDYPGRRLVYLSSGGTIYGDFARGATENTALKPRSYYGAGKVAAEAFIRACTATTDWTATSLRPTNLYGPGQHVTKGFAIIPTLFDRALDGGTFHVWGDGSIVRDYCYVDDLAGAVVAALRATPAQRFSSYNVASGHVATILDLVAACEHASSRSIAVEFRDARGVDVPHVSPSNAAIVAELGWTPQVDLTEGLRRTWQWREHGNSGR